MDHHHARHPLSSPSPTSSPFLFHHSERHSSFSNSSTSNINNTSNSNNKSQNPLTPLLSSTAADGGVDDCFSSPTPTSHHHHHHLHNNGNTNPHSPFDSVVDTRSQSPPQLINHHHNHHNHHNGNSHSNGNSHLHNHLQNHHNHNHNHHHHHHHHLHHHSDSLTGVEDDDDDDGMHNMLSGGSSSSSTSTMPLLTESHSHHSFSRISLEEYSPLSLVEDCDNALPISPTSLACGSLTHSHHSPFKTSLNGLNKIGDNLVSEIVHSDVDHDDARSLSPSLLSSTSAHHHHHHNQHHHGHHNHHHNGHQHHHHHSSSGGHGGNSNSNVLWSNSSTAITQNTSILSSHSTTTSFLLNQHHQQQLNSLMQQLEPQSLDESPQPPPCLLTNNSNSSSDHFDGPSSSSAINTSTNNIININNNFLLGPLDLGDSDILVAHRPSSEPPPSCGTESLISDLECKSLNGQQANTTSSKQANKRKNHQEKQSKKANSSSTSTTAASSVQSTPTRPRRNRSKASAAANAAAAAAAAAAAKQAELSKKAEIEKEQAHSSKVHLQLNHHKKLQELQRRLFGTVETTESSSVVVVASKSEPDKPQDQAIHSKPSTSSESIKVKQEPDSSAAGGKDESAGQQHQPEAATKTEPITRSRPSRARRSRAKSAVGTSKLQEEAAAPAQRVVPTEKVEPDTTTKSNSDCTKLADLLSNTSSSTTTTTTKTNGRGQKNDSSFSSSNVTLSATHTESAATAGSASEAVAVSANNDSNGNEKRTVQTIQVQMSPSLTAVMAANANGLIQPITIQQQQQPHDNGSTSGLLACSNGNGTLTANQIFCRTTTGAAGAAQLKGILSSNELLKSGGSATAHPNENVMTTWTLQPANPNNNNGSGAANQHQAATIGAHQIAIQVICQDGTSLVLPVSSATGLNAAVSLTSQHQQLQAVLANNAAIAFNQQHQRNNMPPISVANIVAQQQTGGIDSSSTITTSASSSQASANSGSHASSGLAASSPTLAALLDAGSSNRSGAMNSDRGASFVSNNLLRKLVSGGLAPQKVQIKRGDQLLQTATDVTFTTVNGGSLVISSPVSAQAAQQESNKQKNQTSTTSEKRIKLSSNENADSGPVNVQATFTLVDPQGLIITGELDKSAKQANQLAQQTTSGGGSNQQHQAAAAAAIVKAVNSDTWKQTKMGSSTGNRQVDPTQPFRCEHCNSTFTRLGNFTRHKKIHTVPTKDGQRFKCDVCSKSFLQRCDLARHLHIHRGTEPHRCNICGKGYIRHSDLVTHQRFHNKEKPFGCPQCSKGFCQRGDLNRHLRSIHLQMKPILCPCCNRKFAKQETLLRHLNTAHRSKPGTTTQAAAATNTAVIAKLSPNYSSLALGDDKQRQQQQQAAAMTVVTNAVALNNNNDNNIQKNATVASLQAIQATLCNIPQSLDPSTTATSTNTSTSPNATTEQQQAQTAKA